MHGYGAAVRGRARDIVARGDMAATIRYARFLQNIARWMESRAGYPVPQKRAALNAYAVAAILTEDPYTSLRKLVKMTGLGVATCSRWRKRFYEKHGLPAPKPGRPPVGLRQPPTTLNLDEQQTDAQYRSQRRRELRERAVTEVVGWAK